MERVNSENRLEDVVGGLNKRKNNYILLKGISSIAIAFFIAVVAALVLSLFSSNPIFYGFLKVLVLLIPALAIIREIVLPLLKKPYDNQLYQKLDELSHSLGEDTLSALELKGNINNSTLLGTSKELAQAHIEKTTHRLQSLDPSFIYPLRNLRKYMFLTISGFILVLLATFLIPGNFHKHLFSLNITPSDTGSNLELADVEITLMYPDYTKLPPQTIAGTKGEINAIKGTNLKFQAEPISSFEEGSLVVKSGISVPVTKNNGKIEAEFAVLESGSFVIEESSRHLASESFNIVLEEDKDPMVSIKSPLGEIVELGSDEKMDVFYEAEDDFEISKLALSWENQTEQSEVPIKFDEQGKGSIAGKISWGPADIPPDSGDTIKIRVLAYDNDNISGPKVGISNSITIKLKDARSKHEETLNFAEQLMEELIDVLGDEINIAKLRDNNSLSQDQKTNPEIIDTDNILKVQRRLTNKIEHANGTLNMTLSSMRDDEYSDFTTFVVLSNMEARIKDLLYERKHLLESFAKIDVGRLNRLMKKEIVEFEDDILFLDSIIKGNKLMDSLYSSNDLLGKYSELSELLKQMQEGKPGDYGEQLQEMMNQISELMSQLAEKMEALSGEIQEGFLNQDAFQAMNMQNQLDEIAKLAQEGNIDQALKQLENMAQGLQNMIASLENGMQSYGSSMMSQGMSELNEFISRIEEIEKQESLLRDKTQGLKDNMLGSPSSNSNNLREFIDEQSKKVKELGDSLSQARAKVAENSPNGVNSQTDHLFKNMLDKTKQLENWMKNMDFDQASKTVKGLEENVQGIKDMSRHNFASLGSAAGKISNANKLAGDIRRGLENLNKEAAGGNQLDQMANRQDEIQAETDDLGKELSNNTGGMFMSPGIGEKLELARNFMGNASQDLHDKQVSKAISNQDEALKALRDAKDQAQQMMQQMQMSAQGGGMPTPMMLGQGMMQPGGNQGADTRYVEIPKVDESLIGKEYKQRILEAMKGGSPEGYIELNKKYYDRIIK